MTKLLPQLADAIPRDVQLDGEIVAWDEEGRPDFHRLSARMLHGDSTISVSYVVFDLLALDRAAVTDQPMSFRRSQLEALELERPRVQAVPSFEDGNDLLATAALRASWLNAKTINTGRGSRVGED